MNARNDEWHARAHHPEVLEDEANNFVAEFDDADKARLAMVAPKMVSLLLDLLLYHECGDSIDGQCRELLEQAGVMQPR